MMIVSDRVAHLSLTAYLRSTAPDTTMATQISSHSQGHRRSVIADEWFLRRHHSEIQHDLLVHKQTVIAREERC